jgi:DNA-binding MarR family transcriptional regulator
LRPPVAESMAGSKKKKRLGGQNAKKNNRGIAMESNSWPEAAELRSVAARLLKLADNLDRQNRKDADDNVSSLEEFRRSAQKAKSQQEEMTGVFAEAIYRDRQRRSKYLPSIPFAEPAWDLLLDLYFRTCRKERVSVSNACSASHVPSATALRWIDILVDSGMIVREADAADRRRIWLKPTDECMAQLKGYLSSMVFMQNAEQLLAS